MGDTPEQPKPAVTRQIVLYPPHIPRGVVIFEPAFKENIKRALADRNAQRAEKNQSELTAEEIARFSESMWNEGAARILLAGSGNQKLRQALLESAPEAEKWSFPSDLQKSADDLNLRKVRVESSPAAGASRY